MEKRTFTVAQYTIRGILVLDVACAKFRESDSPRILSRELFERIEESKNKRVIVDLNGIKFISSDVIGQLIMLHKKCVASSVHVKLCGVTDENRIALDLVRLDRLVELHERKSLAIASFHSEQQGAVPQLPDQAVIAQYRCDAESGDSEAQFQYGKCLEAGLGVPQDFGAAVNCYSMAAKQGHVEAQHALGFALAYGVGTEQDFEQAYAWYKEAADAGHAESQYWVGVSLHHGLVGELDTSRAAKWYNEAAQQGYQPAHQAIADLKRDTANAI